MSKQQDHKTKRTKKIVSITPADGKEESNKIIKAIPKNEWQSNVLRAIDENKVTIITGVAGTGKTYLPVTYGLQMLQRKKYGRIILSRPIVEAGEHLGFLPGDFDEKIAPYMIPVMDILSDHLSTEDIIKMFEEGSIRFLPLAFMRGTTLKDCVVILDECQNATAKQIHMFLTRIGPNCKMVLTGDISQTDIGSQSGLGHVIDILQGINNIEVVTLEECAVVRDPIVAEINARFTKRS